MDRVGRDTKCGEFIGGGRQEIGIAVLRIDQNHDTPCFNLLYHILQIVVEAGVDAARCVIDTTGKLLNGTFRCQKGRP